MLRAKFRNMGFGVIDLHAQIASELCENAFSAEEFLKESDSRAIARIANWIDQKPSVPATQPYYDYLFQFRRRERSLGWQETHKRLYGPIEEQKLSELHLLPETDVGIVFKKKEMGHYIKEIGQRMGFKPGGKMLLSGKSPLSRKIEGTDVLLKFALDLGQSEENFPNQPPVPPAISVELLNSDDPTSVRRINVDDMVIGSLFYQGIQSIHKPYIQGSQINAVPVEHWSNIIKLDIFATITLLDLWISELELAAKNSHS